MAFFDPVEQRICIRIVYDGIACAGKTTNLKMLSSLFTTQRATELYSPGELDGRTLYFDWAQIMAGSVCGVPLMCQVISVPGQLVLTPRRRHLLTLADAVVFVSDSASSGAERGRAAMRLLDDIAADRELPILVQANKQDQGDALSGTALLERLERSGLPVIEAIATEGIGVIDTFVNAVRLASLALTQEHDLGNLRLPVVRAASADDLLERLNREELDPEWAAEMFLEEAETALLLAGASIASAPRGASRGRGTSGPPAPSADVPAGFIWPAHTGRAVVRALGEGTQLAQPIIERAGGLFEQACPDHIVSTSLDARFEKREEARQALVRAARERTQLGALLVPGTVLVAQPGIDESWWVWTIMPRVTSLAETLAVRPLDASRVLDAYAVAVVDALRASLLHGLTLDLGPASFGEHDAALRYVGPVAGSSSVEATATLQAALEGLAAALASTGLDITPFHDAFDRELHRQLTRDEVARIAGALRSSVDAGALRARIEASLARGAEEPEQPGQPESRFSSATEASALQPR